MNSTLATSAGLATASRGFLSCLFLSLTALLLLIPENRAESITGVTQLYSVPASWYQLRTVEIVSYDSTRVAVAWRNEPDTVEHDRGDIMFKSGSSVDGGVTWTWSDTQYLKKSDATSSYVNVIMYNDAGTLYAFIGKANPISNPDTGVAGVVCMKSTDMGVSWIPQAITNSYTAHMILGGDIIKFGNTYFLPFNGTGTQRFLKSTNLIDWSLAGSVSNPENVGLGEGFLVISQDNPNHLICKMRVPMHVGGFAYSSVSTDGGATWSDARKDLELPNWGAKCCFYKDANNQYVYIYGTESERNILYYKTRAPGQPWKAGRPFTSPTLAGKDCYPMLAEYAPGKFYALWENSYHNVYFGKLDVSDAVTTQDVMDSDWNNLTGWTSIPGSGIVEISPAGQLHLKSTTASSARALTNVGPATSFGIDIRAQVSDYTVANPNTGVSLGTKVIAGNKRLMLAFQSDGVYSMTGSNTTWSRVLTQTGDTAWHTWRATVDSAGVARLYRDGSQSLASWTVQVPYENTYPVIEHFMKGVSGNGAEARIDWTSVTEGIVSNDFVDLVGLNVTVGGGIVEISPASQLHLRNTNGGISEITVPNGPGTTAPFSLEFRGKVNTYTVNPPATGVSLGIKVHNGTHRLMLAIQGDGVYSFLAGGTTWAKVYNIANDTNWHTWRVDVDTTGTARLSRDGGPELASWSIQANTGYVRFGAWVTGSSTNPADARLDWVKLN